MFSQGLVDCKLFLYVCHGIVWMCTWLRWLHEYKWIWCVSSVSSWCHCFFMVHMHMWWFCIDFFACAQITRTFMNCAGFLCFQMFSLLFYSLYKRTIALCKLMASCINCKIIRWFYMCRQFTPVFDDFQLFQYTCYG